MLTVQPTLLRNVSLISTPREEAPEYISSKLISVASATPQTPKNGSPEETVPNRLNVGISISIRKIRIIFLSITYRLKLFFI